MFRSTLCVAGFFIAFLGNAQLVRAELIYEIGFDQSSYFVDQGATLEVDLFLTERATDGETLRLANGGGDGLIALGGRLNYADGANTNVLRIGTLDTASGDATNPVAGVDVNSIFNDGNLVMVDNTIAQVDVSGAADPGIEFASTATELQVRLATITFTAVGSPGETASLIYTPTGLDLIFSPFTVVTPDYLTATVTINGVPEPSAGMIVAMGVACAALRRRRNR